MSRVGVLPVPGVLLCSARDGQWPTGTVEPTDMLTALQNPDVTPDALANLVSQDLALLHRLLRFLNSGFQGIPQKIVSARHAIIMLGLEYLRRLCAVVALAAFDDRPRYILTNAVVRARMCELLGKHAGVHASGEYFFAGLLSHLDALLGVSTAEAVHSLPLSTALSLALTMHSEPIGAVLHSVTAFEQGRWEQIPPEMFDVARIQRAYVHAVSWAQEAGVLLAR